MPPLTLTIADRRAVLTLTRPDTGNRLNAPLMLALTDAVAELAARRDYRTLTLAAEGSRFSVGGDIDEFAAADSFADHIRATLPAAHDLFAKLAALPVPIIAAVQGAVAGGGLGLALSADIVIASEAAVFRAGYPAIGVSPDLGSSWHLLRRAGPAFTAEFLMTNRIVTATEARDAGLVNQVTSPANLEERVTAMEDHLITMPTASLSAIKRLISAPGTDLKTHMAFEAREIEACAATADGEEGIAAFVARRPPVFSPD